ncbi:hypothetical protein [Gloeobacter violaceus]|uniref:Gll3872 protein n=1 Tax=Gloeobacter violaceus (strain ATCC 29082 / PCC 7421) TaxID=251221 RepID=Q7NEK7_GLOVI|nr:hypothetical protein [Gloeobacter violaceus]BAC91813.1 gll3872 [Gloeobacter violaceus PCC 7421]
MGIKRIAGAALLLLGVLLLPFVVYAVAYNDFQTAFTAWVVAFPAAVGGFYLLRSTRMQQTAQGRYSDLDIAFATTLKQNQWRISAGRLAQAAGIAEAEAKRYLDEKALALDARFATDESGEEFYVFERKTTH